MIVYLKQHKNYWKLVSIAALIIILGGILTMNWLNDERLKKEKYRQEQDRVINYLVEHYELANGDDIKTIEVTEFQQIKIVGYWRITTKVNNKYKISFKENKIGGEIRSSNYSPQEFKRREKVNHSQNCINTKTMYYREEK
ncbi:TPA: hypothetical protein TUW76_000960 [Streptococcus equi subsp. zooepidemicus]|uniref:DUF3139 domain-containing protein n=3 Tax=Streptococcus equi subsp. zooepidemicus TaxID=40041 RepID=B4U4Q1_STREM|nr:hypothetical protein [Streptococcus equi]ACG62968.1 hypothetical protein Sez_1637 [Streptococcus equi subsp. zooepidemicus MGCS10565]MCD3385510.1 hypothetical protein [Streptococcus equi subsp. zooepidemicus]MCD3387762.1 hypothetical protein [Streptococcus equi subsp. zooepidemicus]MCD3393917.1 hypothetical protein [Streptococcus equi subsp. zooepidemicus]MCD3416757.1 hypothetical protein [Streptococcus equi subsp. zooepidemicus]